MPDRDLRSRLIRLAYSDPSLRPHVLPLLAPSIRVAMEHPSEEARKKYLKEHPKADPKNHTVKKPSGGGSGGGTLKRAPKDRGGIQKAMEAIDKVHRQHGQPDLHKLDEAGQAAWSEIGEIQEALDRNKPGTDFKALGKRLHELSGVLEKSWAEAAKKKQKK